MKLGWTGLVTATVVKDGRVLSRRTWKNLITDAGLDMIAQGMAGIISDVNVKYIALGTGTTAPAASDVKLAAEAYRATFSLQQNPSTGVMYTQIFIAANQADFHIQELGWFAGAGATAAADSGILVARTLYDYDHSAGDTSLFLDRTDTIARG